MTLLPQWTQIRDAIGVKEKHLLSAWLTGSFVNPEERVADKGDIDAILGFKSYGVLDQFHSDGCNPATIIVGGSERPIGLLLGGTMT